MLALNIILAVKRKIGKTPIQVISNHLTYTPS